MKTKLHVGLIGAGWWAAEAHLPALQSHPDAELVALQSRKPEKAAKLAKQFGAKAALQSAEELLDYPGLDAVVISTTPNVHFAQAKGALERGLHVLIEKPMTMTAAESKELIEIADRKGLSFVISCPWHYTRHGILARERVARGDLGDIRMISVLMTNFTIGFYEGKSFAEVYAGADGVDASLVPEIEPNRASYSDPSTSGGGQIYTNASHIFAYLGFLTGLEPVEVSARFANANTAVDVFDVLHITFEGGTLASVATGGTHADLERAFEIRVIGSNGVLVLELWNGTLRLRRRGGILEEPAPLTTDEIYPKFAPALNFVDAALGKAPNLSPATLGHYAMRLIEGSCRSAANKSPVSLAGIP